jgi:hypothetical protein
MFAKMSDECSPARVRKAISGYVKCEQDVRLADGLLNQSSPSSFNNMTLEQEFDSVSKLLWPEVLQKVEDKVRNFELLPKHGPGVTVDYVSHNNKWVQSTWPLRLQRSFPWEEYIAVGWSFLRETEPSDILEPGSEIPVKVITVPKTLKTPRIIAVEPTAMQYAQQGLLGAFSEAVESIDTARSFISWRSQEPNQLLARQASVTGSHATLDLSEASDRVSNQHVRLLLHRFPYLFDAVDDCRSRKADVPGYGVLRLAKFASMGSALCFPVESMVFLTIAFVGIQRELNRPLSLRDIKSFMGEVRTYGDDIIVPTRYVHTVISGLEDFGLRVNTGKSFWTGKFRESCGGDYYDGDDVSITRLRSSIPTSRQHVKEIVSTVSTRNQLYRAGLWRAAFFLDGVLSRLIPMPYVTDCSPSLGRVSFLGCDVNAVQRWDYDLQRPLIKGSAVVANPPADLLDGHGALRKCLTALELSKASTDLPGGTVEHLERAGRPRSVNIKTRWLSPV